MIMLLDDTYQVIKTVNTEEQLFLCLKENWKNLDEQAKQNWQFAQYSHKLLAPFIRKMQGKSFVDMARQACQLAQDMLVVCKGDAENPFLFLVTSDLDIGVLRKEWCRHYCKAYNLHILTG
jgi:hypothetical protein